MGTQHYTPGDARLTEIVAAAQRIVLAQPELWLVVGSQDDLLAAIQATNPDAPLNKATMRWRLTRVIQQLKSWSPTRGPMVLRGDVSLLVNWLAAHPAYRMALLAALAAEEVFDERTATMAEAVT